LLLEISVSLTVVDVPVMDCFPNRSLGSGHSRARPLWNGQWDHSCCLHLLPGFIPFTHFR
jgi:hypothetical protein